MITPPTSIVRSGKRAVERLHLGAPDPAGEPVEGDEEADRHDHDHDLGSMLDRPDHDPLDRGAADEGDHERERERGPERESMAHQRPRDEGRERRHLALREVEDIRGAVDEDERQREARVDRPLREPAHDLLQKLGHQLVTQVALSDALRGARARRSCPAPPPSRPRGRTPATRRSRAIVAFCSTTSTVRPSSSFSRRTMREQLADDRRREAERGLVEHQQPRLRDERPCEGEHLLLAAAQRRRLLVPTPIDPGEVPDHPLGLAFSDAGPARPCAGSPRPKARGRARAPPGRARCRAARRTPGCAA